MEELQKLREEKALLLNELEMIEATTKDKDVLKRIRKFMYDHDYWKNEIL
jgi:hypothetical protein